MAITSITASELLHGVERADNRSARSEHRVADNNDADNAGCDLRAYARGGTLTVNHYRLRITPKNVYYYLDKQFRLLVGNLRNDEGSYAFRLAVRAILAQGPTGDPSIVSKSARLEVLFDGALFSEGPAVAPDGSR